MNALLNCRTFLINFYMGKIAHRKNMNALQNKNGVNTLSPQEEKKEIIKKKLELLKSILVIYNGPY